MLHHVGLEVAAEHVDACVDFWATLGWHPVPQPASIAGGRWLERGAAQIHLQVRAAPTIPPVGHPAFVDDALDETARRLAEHGYEVLERTAHWGARRIFTRCPAGHRVELMAAPPAAAARLLQVEAIQLGHLRPSRHEIGDERGRRVVAGVHLSERPQLRV
jgi:catechol 2,3-dioxygenase-like lactoylglutathione lyase family enzyme